MQIYDGPAAAADAARNWLIIHEADIPEHLHDRLIGLTVSGTSPLPMMHGFIQAVYANRDDFSNEALEIAAGLADLFERSGYHGKLGGKALAIRDALRRDAGEQPADGSSWPDPENDPEPSAAFYPSATTPPEPLPSPQEAMMRATAAEPDADAQEAPAKQTKRRAGKSR